MKTEFIVPSFQGSRFSEHTLPLEFAKDLAAYEELIFELAKHLYFKEHPLRKRVPKGFDKNFSLHLDRIDEGSTKPVIAMVCAGLLSLYGLDQSSTTYFERARDIVTECIKNGSSENFPREFLRYFNQIGGSLRDDESINFQASGSSVAVLTPKRRKELVLGIQASYSREIELMGSIGEIDWKKSSFRLEVDGGGNVICPFDEKFDDELRGAGGKDLWRATIKCLADFDLNERIQKVKAIHSMTVMPNYCVVRQIEDLALLEDGWCHIKSKAPSPQLLDWSIGKIEESYPPKLGLPMIGASPEGNLFFEWKLKDWRVSAEIEYPSYGCEFQAVNIKNRECVDLTFNLTLDDEWTRLYGEVEKYV